MAGFLMTLANRHFFPELVAKGGCAVEVGVFHGDFSQSILDTVQPEELHLVDQWALDWKEINPFPDTPRHLATFIRAMKQYVGEEDVNAGLEKAYQHVCARFGGNRKVKILRQPSAQAAAAFPDNSIDYLYVDANHSYEFVFRDLLEWWPKVRHGGLITMNDFYESSIADHAYGVIPAVATAMKRLPLKPLAVCWSNFSDCVLYKEPMSDYTRTFLSNLLAQDVPMIYLPSDLVGNYHHTAVQIGGVVRKEFPSFVLGTS